MIFIQAKQCQTTTKSWKKTRNFHPQNLQREQSPANALISDFQPLSSVQFSSVSQSCLTLCNPMNCSTPGLPVHHQLPESTQTHESVMASNHLILCHPLLLLPSIFPSTRVFSNESALRIRWPKYWSFSFNISPSNEHLGLISFRMEWLDLLLSKGLSRVFSNTTVQKHLSFHAQLSFQFNSHIHT